jgi:hypothetical protein
MRLPCLSVLAGGASSGKAADAEFVPSAAFTGARPGYVFTTGARGVGYYRDKGPAAAAAATAAVSVRSAFSAAVFEN